MAVVFVVSINVPTAYFLVVCVWCSVGVVNDGNVVCLCGGATIFLPWVLHFLGALFCYWGVIFGVGYILN